jgi:N-glycosylase/DNA lyase
MWYVLTTNRKELRLDTTLLSGQSFGWRATGEQEWSHVLSGHLITLKQTANDVLFQPVTEHSDEETVRGLLRNYFHLDVCLEDLSQTWCRCDSHFAHVAPRFPGLRLLRQDPVETLFSFICSSNNHIRRITGMVSLFLLFFFFF